MFDMNESFLYRVRTILLGDSMVDIHITKMSTKGQVVIPVDMRKNIKEGEKLVLIQNGKQVIIKKLKDMDSNFEDDLKFAKETEEALEEYNKGKLKMLSKDEFLKKMEK